MSMPTKGKHHHPNHHHQQPHNSHIQTQHIIGLNISQATVPSVSHTAHAQHYNPAILNNTSRFVSHPGSDFHVPGQNFGAQATGQVGGSANSIAVQGGRNPSLGTIQPIGQASSGVPPGISSSGQSQTSSGPNIQPQSAPNSSVSTAMVHNQPSQDMSKQTHLQSQPVSMQQVYVQNSNRQSTPQYQLNNVKDEA
ncbi:hypothetical protein TSAR_009434 [Trichomalopsis sarcophagae]|uniref:Uncharacterized protein n=1 Tax=Trichomalopsis sarcophagae TaxID=543379 RepID=A0A232EU30_9HYME|nr:hypothetical protein TSAR_009434 [Trichomalopsis sarcophagae]